MTENETKRIHYVGRLSAEKNLPMLLCATYFLKDVKLYIYGDTNVLYFEYLLNLCELLKISNRVFFMGHFIDKYDLYNYANCVILPSVHEGLPYCLLEAEVYKIPVIYNNISKINLHLNGHKNIAYVYEGYPDNLEDILYVDNYKLLLKSIGYIEYIVDVKSMIELNKFTKKSDLKKLALVSLITCDTQKIIVGKRYMIPPFLSNNINNNSLFDKNVNILIKAIKDFFINQSKIT